MSDEKQQPGTDPQLRTITLLTVRQVADALGINKDTVWHLRRMGTLPEPIRLGKQTVRWRLTDIEEFLRLKRVEADKARPGRELGRKTA